MKRLAGLLIVAGFIAVVLASIPWETVGVQLAIFAGLFALSTALAVLLVVGLKWLLEG